MVGGCAGGEKKTPPLPCTKRPSPCSSWDVDCDLPRPKCVQADLGPTQGWVDIQSSPTPAAIYQDGKFIGYTPMRHVMAFTSKTSRISLVAVPLYAGQAQQERLIKVPPLPERVSFLMNNPGAGAGTLTGPDS